MNLLEFLDQLDSVNEPIPFHQLIEHMRQLELSVDDVSELLRFDSDKYQRNLIHRTSNYEALLLCFEAGQRTAIHDHCGSACGVRILQGEAVETAFEQNPDGWLYATGSTTLPEGGVVGSQDMDVHQLSNLQSDGKRLVSLHVYSPPQHEVGNYSVEDNSVIRVAPQSKEILAAPWGTAQRSAKQNV